jgi:hypothetical protein
MKKVVFIIPILLVSSVLSGQGQTGIAPAPVIIDLPRVMSEKKAVRLSDLAERIRYVPLETTKKYLIGEESVSVKPCGDLIFVSEHGKPVGVFDSSGKFLRTIGRIGRGPGEYNFDYLFWPDENPKRVYVWNADAGTIMSFSWEGQYLADIKPAVKPGSFVPLGNDRFFTWTFMQKEENGKFYRMVVNDAQGNALKKVFEPRKKYDFSRVIRILSPFFTRTVDGYLCNTWENDSIFRIGADGSFLPVLSWKLGRYRLPYDPLSVPYDRLRRDMPNYVMDVNAAESPSMWLVSYDYKKVSQLGVVLKSTGEFFQVANPDTAAPGVWNDIDGGPSFWPLDGSVNGRTFVRILQAVDLIAPDQRVRPVMPVRKPEEQRKLRELVAELTENSNPVIMLVDLK